MGGSDISSKTPDGYTRLPSGLIIQWGSTTSGGGVNGVSFPISFPNAILAGSGSVSGYVGWFTINVSNQTPSGFSVSAFYNNALHPDIPITWLAIGY